jgi:aryl-alcohol dehydrogenase-like predicted oxidoreductase
MKIRRFGALGNVSAITLGGGGIGGYWGPTERAEAAATVSDAVAAGVTLLDVAPSYGTSTEPRRAERVIGEVFGGDLPPGVRVLTKVEVDDESDIRGRIRESLEESLRSIRRDRVDILLHHYDLRPARIRHSRSSLAVELYRETLRFEFEQLRDENLVGAWGLTATGHPEAIAMALVEEPRPQLIQAVTNVLDSPGSLWHFGPSETPDGAGTRRLAAESDVAVMGIRSLQGGALTDAHEHTLEKLEERLDHRRAENFRALAKQRGETAAILAYRYALSIDSVDTVVVGVKNRSELADCVIAEAAPPLSEGELVAIRLAVGLPPDTVRAARES